MKKVFLATGIWAMAAAMTGCGGAEGNDPGRAYMPDMYYSRAYETYGYNNIDDYQKLKERGVTYNATPVKGTMARGDASSMNLPANDSGYALATNYPNPLANVQLTPTQMKEADRIYQVNCGICHGSKLDGNGPLWKDGNGPYPAAPRNLLDDYSKALSDGKMFHAITYGRGQMGSYASQVHPEQRWWIISYIRSKQGGGTATTASDSAATTAAVNASTASTTDTSSNASN
ncbi:MULTISPECIES: c-type cytochrome [Chitinophagaceae]|uniref:c-type cytochrome n=1 Tax=Chitinophagaceae TaxID=563835 RepID=UPI000DEEDB57|nr:MULTISPECIES: cytochrome c [Chitinophagaceae]RPD51001.1 cytochrome c [Paracnuella aquatica]